MNTCIFSRVVMDMTCTEASRHLYTTTTTKGSTHHSRTGHWRVCTMLRSRVSKTTTLRAINPMEQCDCMPRFECGDQLDKYENADNRRTIFSLTLNQNCLGIPDHFNPGHGPQMMAHVLRDEHFPDLLKRLLL
jgi:hypothetical protein